MIKQKIIINISTCFKLGFFPKASGTIGSLAALPFIPIIIFLNNWESAALLLFIFIIGLYSADEYSKKIGYDPEEVVIDEFLGLLLTVYTVQFFVEIKMPLVIILFIMFRIFDILKPWPICMIDQKVKGGLGIMLDDVLASFISGLLIGGVIKLAS